MILHRPRGEYWHAFFDLIACFTGFGLSLLIEQVWLGARVGAVPMVTIAPCIRSALIAWVFMVFPETQWNEGIRMWVDGYLATIGGNLLVQCALMLFGIRPASWLVIVLGCSLAIVIEDLGRKWFPGETPARRKEVCLVNFADRYATDPMTLQQETGIECTAPLHQLTGAANVLPPGLVVFNGRPTAVPLRQLFALHYSGCEIESLASWYERVWQRVAWQYLEPSDLLFFLNPQTSRALMAFQAVYKNVVGLALRLIFAPVMILISLMIVIFTRGPALEQVECLGFRRTPFQMLRFRVMDSTGNLTHVGKMITRLRLTNLPQLMNVVRGEMTLFGPAPVRTAFAERISELLPAYVYRFTVKPGIFSWFDARSSETGPLCEEMVRLEYDLYYIRQESPSLDLEILLRVLFHRTPAKQQAAPIPDMLRNS